MTWGSRTPTSRSSTGPTPCRSRCPTSTVTSTVAGGSPTSRPPHLLLRLVPPGPGVVDLVAPRHLARPRGAHRRRRPRVGDALHPAAQRPRTHQAPEPPAGRPAVLRGRVRHARLAHESRASDLPAHPRDPRHLRRDDAGGLVTHPAGRRGPARSRGGAARDRRPRRPVAAPRRRLGGGLGRGGHAGAHRAWRCSWSTPASPRACWCSETRISMQARRGARDCSCSRERNAPPSWLEEGVGPGFSTLSEDNRYAPGYSSVSQRGFDARLGIGTPSGKMGSGADPGAVRAGTTDPPAVGGPPRLPGRRRPQVVHPRVRTCGCRGRGRWSRGPSTSRSSPARRPTTSGTGGAEEVGRVTAVLGDVDVTAEDVGAEQQSYGVVAPDGGRLVFRDLYWPGYVATVDGTPVPVTPFKEHAGQRDAPARAPTGPGAALPSAVAESARRDPRRRHAAAAPVGRTAHLGASLGEGERSGRPARRVKISCRMTRKLMVVDTA